MAVPAEKTCGGYRHSCLYDTSLQKQRCDGTSSDD